MVIELQKIFINPLEYSFTKSLMEILHIKNLFQIREKGLKHLRYTIYMKYIHNMFQTFRNTLKMLAIKNLNQLVFTRITGFINHDKHLRFYLNTKNKEEL